MTNVAMPAIFPNPEGLKTLGVLSPDADFWSARRAELTRSLREMENNFGMTAAEFLRDPTEEGEEYRLVFNDLRKCEPRRPNPRGLPLLLSWVATAKGFDRKVGTIAVTP